MKKNLLILALLFGAMVNMTFAQKGSSEAELLRKSNLSEPGNFAFPTSAGAEDTGFPRNFDALNQQNTPTGAAVSTGYYWIDSDEEWSPAKENMFPKMRPKPTYVDTSFEPGLWRKIIPGPRILPKEFWTSSNNKEGYAFFRNPADGSTDNTFWTAPEDSTDDAIAGPIPIGIKGGFFFNGLRYDSFYVSTNGVIALTNRRYFYSYDPATGNPVRVIPAGSNNAYDPMSMDWFANGVRGHDTLWLRNWNNTNDSISPSTLKKIPVLDGNGYQQYKNGLNDPVADNFGYQFSVLGQDPTNITGFDRTNKQNGIRARGGAVNSLNPNSKAALIAVFWGDLCLSQYDPDKKVLNEHGMVWYKRTFSGDSLIISFLNAQPKGNLVYNPYGSTYNMRTDARPGPNYVTADAQVVLDRIDSSVTIHYRRVTDGIEAIFGKPTASEVFRYNTTSGVRGFARHVNFGKGGITNGQPWAGEYEQHTTYWYKRWDGNQTYPNDFTAVKFKQYQNTLRVADIQYRVRSQELLVDDPLAFTVNVPSTEVDDYELLSGHERLGAVQPVALIQNLTNEIQGPDGVNFVKQDLEFRARFRIINQITGRIIYNRIVPVDQKCLSLPNDKAVDCMGDPSVKVRLAKKVTNSSGNLIVATTDTIVGTAFTNGGYRGIPPYYFVWLQFPPFEPNEFIDNHIGRHRAYIIAEPSNPASGASLGDRWPFDDTSSVRLFVMKRFAADDPDPRYQRFEDNGTSFHVDKESNVTIPSAYKWVNINGEIVSGDVVSQHPLPPRGEFVAENVTTRKIKSPVIKLNRLWGAGNNTEPLPKNQDKRSPARGGDEIRSFPIDLRGKYNSTLSISVQRTATREDWPRGFGDEVLIGPEPRCIQASDPFTVWNGTGAASAVPDELVVEFARPSDDGIKGITNIILANWRHHPQRRGGTTGAITDMAALTVYGAGGYLIGFLEGDKDSALALPASPKINSLRPKPLDRLQYDDGIDLEYKKFFIPIPDTFINWKANGAKNFRFRVKNYSTNDQKTWPMGPGISDDADDYFVDNIKISFPAEITDIEAAAVKIQWPYSQAPASQATAIPIVARVTNNTHLDAPVFSVKVKIYRIDAIGNLIDGYDKPIYCRTESVGNLNSGSELDVLLPNWNARKSQADSIGRYRIYSIVIMPEKDLEPKNDTTYKDISLLFGKTFAYDPATGPATNNVPQFAGTAGGGMNLPGTNFQGIGAYSGAVSSPWNKTRDGSGSHPSVGSGAIAMKFELLNTDTLKGFSAYFAPLNQASDQITFRVYEGSEDNPSQKLVIDNIRTTRGGVNQNIYGQYVDYILSNPVVIPRGIYWISISQDGETGIELGASASRSGMRTTNTFVDQTGALGTAGTQLYLDKNFRRVQNGNLINSNYFAFENTSTSSNWVQFTPTTGLLGYGHLDHFGQTDVDKPQGGGTRTLTRGSWIPMLRPYFGAKAQGEALNEYQWCPDDIPVELVKFDGSVRESGIDLYWETASETNNHGFFVERRVYSNEGTNEFQQIGFVNGKGNSNSSSYYNYADANVKVKTTYQYRLRQVDFDGTQNCGTSQIVTLTYDKDGSFKLEPNQPNPFMSKTTITYNIEFNSNVKLDVVDIFGNVVKVLVNGEVSSGSQSVEFDGTDTNGNLLPSGNYIYRLTNNGKTITGKMAITR